MFDKRNRDACVHNLDDSCLKWNVSKQISLITLSSSALNIIFIFPRKLISTQNEISYQFFFQPFWKCLLEFVSSLHVTIMCEFSRAIWKKVIGGCRVNIFFKCKHFHILFTPSYIFLMCEFHHHVLIKFPHQPTRLSMFRYADFLLTTSFYTMTRNVQSIIVECIRHFYLSHTQDKLSIVCMQQKCKFINS